MATPAPHPSAATVARAGAIHPLDDDDGGSDSGGDDGGESAGTSAGPGSDDGGEGAGSTDGGGSSDAGEGAGDSGTVDGGTTTSPVDTDPTAGGSDSNGGGGADAGTAPDGGGESTILYPTGDPSDDALFDDGGGTTIVFSPAPRAANFGGALHVTLPAQPVVGDAGVATVDVFNTGGPASGKFELALGVTPDGSAASAIRIADEQVPVHLGHDRVAVYKVPFTLPATLVPGSYRFLALVDAGNAFDETDEADNVAIGPSFTVAAATSDLSVTSANTHAKARAGKAAAVAVHLRAMGTMAESGTTTVTVTATPVDGSVAPIRLASVVRPVRLGRGQATTLQFRVPLPAMPAGRYQLTVTVTPVSPADTNAADKSAVTDVATIA